jgi:hypothetical protein
MIVGPLKIYEKIERCQRVFYGVAAAPPPPHRPGRIAVSQSTASAVSTHLIWRCKATRKHCAVPGINCIQPMHCSLARPRTYRGMTPSTSTTVVPAIVIIILTLNLVGALALSSSACPSASSSPASLLQGARALRKDKNDAAADACLRCTRLHWHTHLTRLHWHTHLTRLHWHTHLTRLHWNTHLTRLHWHTHLTHLHWHTHRQLADTASVS